MIATGLVSHYRAGLRSGVRGAVLFGVHVVLWFAPCKAHDERGHGHFDVEFYHVDDGVELDVYDGVFEEHEADEKCLERD